MFKRYSNKIVMPIRPIIKGYLMSRFGKELEVRSNTEMWYYLQQTYTMNVIGKEPLLQKQDRVILVVGKKDYEYLKKNPDAVFVIAELLYRTFISEMTGYVVGQREMGAELLQSLERFYDRYDLDEEIFSYEGAVTAMRLVARFKPSTLDSN